MIGAEKHDIGPPYPSYEGKVDELRFSTVERYSGNFTRPTAPFGVDVSTAALYHLDGDPGVCAPVMPDASGQVNATSAATATLPAHDPDTPFPGGGTTTTAPTTSTLPTTTTTTTTTTLPPTTTTTTTTLPPRPRPRRPRRPCRPPPPPRRPRPCRTTTTTTTTTLPPTTTTTTTTLPPTTTTTTLPPTTTTTSTTTTTTTLPPTTTTTTAPPPAVVKAAFNAMTPLRVFDTRPGPPVAALQTVEIAVAGVNGVPPGALNATVNLAVNGPSAGGFLAAYPCGGVRPYVSNLNYAAGQTIANLATVGLSPQGRLCIYTSATTPLIVDLLGWGATTGQSYTTTTPERLYDTRPNRLAAGGTGSSRSQGTPASRRAPPPLR